MTGVQTCALPICAGSVMCGSIGLTTLAKSVPLPFSYSPLLNWLLDTSSCDIGRSTSSERGRTITTGVVVVCSSSAFSTCSMIWRTAFLRLLARDIKVSRRRNCVTFGGGDVGASSMACSLSEMSVPAGCETIFCSS